MKFKVGLWSILFFVLVAPALSLAEIDVLPETHVEQAVDQTEEKSLVEDQVVDEKVQQVVDEAANQATVQPSAVENMTVAQDTYQPEPPPVVSLTDTDANGDGVVDILDWIQAAKQTDSSQILDDIAEKIVE